VEVDARGRARTIKAIDGSAPRGGVIPNAPETESGGRGSGGRTTVKSAYRSKWEPIFATKLDMEQKAGLIRRWWYEPSILYLEDQAPPGKRRKRHIPDFWIWLPDGRLKIVAVKGYHKNIRESLTIIRWAAQRYPFAEWWVTWLRAGAWEEERIGDAA
jgi:hypothetical protein